MKQNDFPPGWNEERVRRVLAHYEEQTEGEAVAEDEAALEDRSQTVMGVAERRQRLARYTTWTAEDLEEFNEALAAQRIIDDPLWR